MSLSNRYFGRWGRGAGAALVGGLALAGCATPAVVFVSPNYSAARVRRVAVVGLDDYPGQAGSGPIVSDVLQQYLIPLGYELVEREQAQTILSEQSFQVSQNVNAAMAQNMGRILNVDALILGTITDFSQTSEQTVMVDMPMESIETVSGTGGRGGRGWSSTDFNQTDQMVPQTETLPAHIGISVRMVDVKTGAVLWSGSASSDGSDIASAAQGCSQGIMTALKKSLAHISTTP